MSDNATLVTRLRTGAEREFAAKRFALHAVWMEAAARIAELEATLDQERRTYASVAEQLKARIAELEAEVDRLNMALAGVAQWFEEHDNLPYAKEIRAALSGEGVT